MSRQTLCNLRYVMDGFIIGWRTILVVWAGNQLSRFALPKPDLSRVVIADTLTIANSHQWSSSCLVARANGGI